MGWLYSIDLKRDVWVASVIFRNIETTIAPYNSRVIFWDDKTSSWVKGTLDHFEPPREH